MSYNVTTDFGANNLDNTGATDNTSKLGAIFGGTSIPALTAPYTLYFPAGTYKFSSEPSAVPSKVCIVGDGMNQTFISGARASHLTDDVWQLSTNSDITIKDLQFTTSDDANAVSQGLSAAGGSGIVLERVKFTNTYASGLRLTAPTQIMATQCEFTHIYQHANASMISGALASSSFTACRFYANGGTTNTSHCVYLNGSTVPSNVSFVGCVFQNWSGGQAIEFDGDELATPQLAQCVTVDSCQFLYGSNSAAAIVANEAQGFTVNNCQFFSTAGGMNGINIFTCNSWAVTNCTFNNASTVFGGVMVQSGLASTANVGTYGIIKDNVFVCGNGTYSLTTAVGLFAANYVLIEGNVFVGVGLGIQTYAFGNTANASNITVKNNQMLIPPGATKHTSGGAYFGSSTNTYAFASDGPATNIRFIDNVVSGFTYEVYFTQSSYTGQVNGFTYRNGNFGAQGTFGFANSAAPTNMVRLGASSMPVTPATITSTQISSIVE